MAGTTGTDVGGVVGLMTGAGVAVGAGVALAAVVSVGAGVSVGAVVLVAAGGLVGGGVLVARAAVGVGLPVPQAARVSEPIRKKVNSLNKGRFILSPII